MPTVDIYRIGAALEGIKGDTRRKEHFEFGRRCVPTEEMEKGKQVLREKAKILEGGQDGEIADQDTNKPNPLGSRLVLHQPGKGEINQRGDTQENAVPRMDIPIEDIACHQEKGVLSLARQPPIQAEDADEEDEVIDALEDHGKIPPIRSQK